MPKPLRLERIPESLPECFRPMWERIASGYLNGEPVFFAEYCCQQDWHDESEGKGLLAGGKVLSFPVLIVVTSFRWIKGYFGFVQDESIYHAFWSRRVVYRKQGARFFSFDDLAEWRWLFPLEKPVPKHIGMIIKEKPLSDIRVVSRNDYSGVFDGNQLSLTEIEVKDRVWYAALSPGGEQLYELLRLASQNRGRLFEATVVDQATQSPSAKVINQLEQIAKLHEAGILDKLEFERLKSKILGQ